MNATHRDPLIHLGFYKTATTWLQDKFFIPKHGYSQAYSQMDIQRLFVDPQPFRFDVEGQLMAKEIKVDPVLGFTSQLAAQNIDIKFPRDFFVEDRCGQVKGAQAVRFAAHSSYFGP